MAEVSEGVKNRQRRAESSAAAPIVALAVVMLIVLIVPSLGGLLVALMGAYLAAALILGAWVWEDAATWGLPRIPWLFVVLLLLPVGLGLYLVAREVRRNRPQPPNATAKS